MEKCKTKAIQADLSNSRMFWTYPDTIRYIQVCSGVNQAYSQPCLALAYSELWQV